MILLRLTMLEGRSDAQKRALCERLTAAAQRHFGRQRDEIRLIVHEVSDLHWSVGGVTMRDRTEATG